MTRWSKFVISLCLWSAACGDDASRSGDTDSNTSPDESIDSDAQADTDHAVDTDEGLDTDHQADTDDAPTIPATLVADDVPLAYWHKYLSEWRDGLITSTEFHATVEYSETGIGDDVTCTRTLALTGTPRPGTCSDRECTWGWDMITEQTDTTGDCIGGSPDVPLPEQLPGLVQPARIDFHETRRDGGAVDSTTLRVYFGDPGYETWVDLYRYTPSEEEIATGFDPLDATIDGFRPFPIADDFPMPGYEVNWDICEGVDEPEVSDVSHIGAYAVTDSVPCDAEWADQGDVWTFEVPTAGTTWSATLDTTAPYELELDLVSPNGCPLEVPSEIACTGGARCPSGTMTLDAVGTWQLRVHTGYECVDEADAMPATLPYTLDMQLGAP